ncbi:MAG: nucleotidyltransferase family protein [Bryobacterales bacterium]|nr:nucleotidyltransferase family protein [Bryobacterales bacterium]
MMPLHERLLSAGLNPWAIREVAARHGATRVRVFGSFARGDSSSNSDIDLLVELAHGRSLLDLVAIKQDLQDLLGRRVDVVTERSLSPYFRDAVCREAVAI